MLRTSSTRPILLKNYHKPAYRIETVDLDFQLYPERTLVTSKLLVKRNKGTKLGTALKLDGDGLKFISVMINGKALDKQLYSVTPDALTLKSLPANAEITIVTEVNPTENKALSGLYRSGGNFCTQCEAEGFRRITYFMDRPDILAVYTVRLEAALADAPLLLSNGNPVEQGHLPGGRHFAIWHDPHPKPSYLFALVAGDLGSIHENFVTSEGRKVRLGIYVEKGKENRASYAMDALIRSMKWDEEVFGCAYDLDVFNIVAVSDFNMGAMENKGLNIFNDKYVLADENTATDADFARIEAIIAHEYFHNWTGNRITCRDWFQLCLKEGLTVFRDQEFSSDMRSRGVKRIEDVALLRAHQFPEDQGPLAHAVRPESYREINNFYTATIYEKGAELVRMIATLLGPKKFASGMKRYLSKHDGDAATIEDFVACFEVAGKIDLAQFFLWYRQAGTPHLHVSTNYDGSAKTFTVEVEQSLPPSPDQPHKRLMHIPVRIGLIDPVSGLDFIFSKVSGIEHEGDVFNIKNRQHKIVFHGISRKPVLSINRGFSAPIELDYRLSDKELALLAAHDKDSFNRWQSFRTMAVRQILGAMRAMAKKSKPKWSVAFLDAAVSIAIDTTLEPAFRAVTLQLPSEAELGQIIGKNLDPDAIRKARNAMMSAIGQVVEPHRQKLLADLVTEKPFSPGSVDAGKRSLSNLLLAYALSSGNESAEVEIIKQFNQASNMTDREAAFRLLVREMTDSQASVAAIDKFFEDYKDDAIVLDKWFQTQSMVPGKQSLAVVKKLTAHRDFSWTNPNRMRSVIGTFAQANPTGFNRPDGAGYGFVIDAIAKLDAINPQTAARLLTAFRSWRMFEAGRRKHAEFHLKRLKMQKGLSRDVSEILDRTLA